MHGVTGKPEQCRATVGAIAIVVSDNNILRSTGNGFIQVRPLWLGARGRSYLSANAR
jgi:hypothetical protein